MTLFLNNNLFTISVIMGLISQLANMLMNSSDELKEDIKGTRILKIVSMIIYIICFSFFTFSVAFSDGIGFKSILVLIGSLFIFVSKFIGKINMDILNISTMNMKDKIYMSMFILGWIILGLLSGYKRYNIGLIIGFLSSILIIIGKTLILPYQTDKKIINLPGNSLQTVGMILISLVNSMIDSKMLGIQTVTSPV